MTPGKLGFGRSCCEISDAHRDMACNVKCESDELGMMKAKTLDGHGRVTRAL